MLNPDYLLWFDGGNDVIQFVVVAIRMYKVSKGNGEKKWSKTIVQVPKECDEDVYRSLLHVLVG